MVAARHGIDADPTILHGRFRAAFHAAPPLAFPACRQPICACARRRGGMPSCARSSPQCPSATSTAISTICSPSSPSAAAWRADPDAAPLLTRLRAAGVRILVVSNFDDRVRGVLAALGLADLVDQITISSEAGAAKPDPRIFATALAAAGLAPVGGPARRRHRTRGSRGGARRGAQVVLVGGDELGDEAPDATRVPRLADLDAVIARRLR